MIAFEKDELAGLTLEQVEERIEAAAEELAALYHQLENAGKLKLKAYSVGSVMRATALGMLRGSWTPGGGDDLTARGEPSRAA